MTMEGFVRAVGVAMGLARDSFGAGAAGEVAPPAELPPAPARPALGAGLAAEAADTESGQLNTHAAALAEQNRIAHTHIADVVASANAGRARMDGIIGAATGDVTALAPASTTPHGQRALARAMVGHLQNSKQMLQDKYDEATTHAAGAHTTAEAFHSVLPSTGPPSASPASATPMGATPLSGLSGLSGVMGSQSDRSGGQSANQRQGTNTAATAHGNSIEAVIARALSQHGTPSSWGGGGKHGPGPGDDGTVGFDCSSLMQYAFAGAGVDLPRTTYEQIGLGRSVSPRDIQAGDLIFSNFDRHGPGHVQLAISPNRVVEAPQSNENVQVSAMPAGRVVVRRIL